MEETAEIARTQYPQLPGDTVNELMAALEKFPYQTKSSYAVDLENKAPQNEGELFGEAIIKLGQNVGKPVPTIQWVYQKINQAIGQDK